MRIILLAVIIFILITKFCFAAEPLNILGLTPNMAVSDALDKIKKEHPSYDISKSEVQNGMQKIRISSDSNDDVIYLVILNNGSKKELIYIETITRHDDIEAFFNESKDNFYKKFGEPIETRIARNDEPPYRMLWFGNIYKEIKDCQWDIEYIEQISTDMTVPDSNCENILVVSFSSQDRGGKRSISQILVNPSAVADYIANLKYSTSAVSERKSNDDELITAITVMGRSFGFAKAQAINCQDETALRKISSLRGGVIATFANAGLFDKIDAIDSILDQMVAAEQERMSSICYKESLALYMRGLERDLEYFAQLMSARK